MKRPLEDNPWFIGGIIISVLLFMAVLVYFMEKSFAKSDAEYAKYQKEVAARPIRDLRNGFVEVQQMNCHKIIGGYSKRQLSKLTEEEKWLVKDSTECEVTFQHVRWRKEGILGYNPHFSIFLWRNSPEDDNDLGAPMHVKEIGIENCEVALKNKVELVVVEGKCELMDKAL